MTRGLVLCRPYTPTSETTHRGHVDFVIKLYPQGAMSQVRQPVCMVHGGWAVHMPCVVYSSKQ
jgi:hypothetical protein